MVTWDQKGSRLLQAEIAAVSSVCCIPERLQCGWPGEDHSIQALSRQPPPFVSSHQSKVYIYIHIYTHFIYIYGYIKVTPGFPLLPAESKGSFLYPSWVNTDGHVCQGWAFVWQHISKFMVGTGALQENKEVGRWWDITAPATPCVGRVFGVFPFLSVLVKSFPRQTHGMHKWPEDHGGKQDATCPSQGTAPPAKSACAASGC